MNNKIKSLAFLVNLGIYGVAAPAFAAETTTKDADGETMVVTAAEQSGKFVLQGVRLLGPENGGGIPYLNALRRVAGQQSIECRQGSI